MATTENIVKDFKIYDLCMRAMMAESLFHSIMFCITISYQLDESHIDKIQMEYSDFNLKKERRYFESLLTNSEFVRFLDKRMTILASDEPYQYFDELVTDDVQDVYNFDDKNESKRLDEYLHISQFLGKVMSGLAISKDDLEKIFGE